ncbi:MAG: hypothetical protein WKF87_04040 [Chryseolinea sp.]
MTRLLLATLVLLPLVTDASYPQSDPFEKVEVPSAKNDFGSIVNFWKQINAVKNEDLLQFDSILFFVNDSLKYTYYIADLKFFARNMAMSDSVLRASTDSIFNKELNCYDTYFTDIGNNSFLQSRKHLNSGGLCYKAEQFSEGDVAVVTNWVFDKTNNVVQETNKFIQDSSLYQMVYKRQGPIILQRRANVERRSIQYEYIIDYNKKGGIIGYSYLNRSSEEKSNQSFKVNRSNDDLVAIVEGVIDNRFFSFNISRSENVVKIYRQNTNERTYFKLVMF